MSEVVTDVIIWERTEKHEIIREIELNGFSEKWHSSNGRESYEKYEIIFRNSSNVLKN